MAEEQRMGAWEGECDQCGHLVQSKTFPFVKSYERAQALCEVSSRCPRPECPGIMGNWGVVEVTKPLRG